MKHKKRTEADRVEEPAVVYGVARELGSGQVVERIRKGLPMVEFEALREMLGVGAEELAGHLSISRSTLARRRKAGFLDPLESDRLVRYARLFAIAQDVLGAPEEAAAWLKMPARALGFVVPLEFAETEAGAREVEDLLGRIEYGVYT